jgi:hypothetical protein
MYSPFEVTLCRGFPGQKRGGVPPGQVLLFFEQLYCVERQARNEKPDKIEMQADGIRRFRQQHSIPDLNTLMATTSLLAVNTTSA